MINKVFVVLIAVIASATLLIGLATWRQVEAPDHKPPGLCKDKPKSNPNSGIRC
jgi:hypothetical protein